MATDAFEAALGCFLSLSIGTFANGLNSESPVATTLAMWPFLLRSADCDGFIKLAILKGAGDLLHETRDACALPLYIKARQS